MTYFEFLDDIIKNFRVSKMIDIVKIEQDMEENDLRAVAYEATRALIIVANYKQVPNIDLPQTQGISQMDFIKQIIDLEKNADKSSVTFKKQDDDIALETTFKIDTAKIKNKNVSKTLLPETPNKLSQFKPDFEFEFKDTDIAKILKFLKVSILNADIYLMRNAKDKLTFKLTNEVDTMDFATDFDLEEGQLDDPFKIDLEKLLSIFAVASDGLSLAVSEKQNLTRIIKDNDTAEYNYFLVKKVS